MAQANKKSISRRSILTGTAAASIAAVSAAPVLATSTVSPALITFESKLRQADAKLHAADNAVEAAENAMKAWDRDNPISGTIDFGDGDPDEAVAAHNANASARVERRIAALQACGVARHKEQVTAAETALDHLCLDCGKVPSRNLADLKFKAKLVEFDTGSIEASIVTDLLDGKSGWPSQPH